MSGLTYLITGANRGIGKALLATFLLRPHNTVIASVRDITSARKILDALPVGQDSKLIIVEIEATSPTSALEAVETLKSKHGITKIDILISNAGYMGPIGPVLTADPSNVLQHLSVNFLGPLSLIQAFHPLLAQSSHARFFVLTSTIGSFGEMDNYPVPFFAYGVSKTAANYLVGKLHQENKEWLTAVAFNPGWVQTEMGDGAAKAVGMAGAPTGLEESVGQLVGLFDGVEKGYGGRFVGNDGKIIPW